MKSWLALSGVISGLLFATSCTCPFVSAEVRDCERLEKGWQLSAPGEKTETVSVPHCWNAIDGADGGGTTNSSVDGTGFWRGAKTYTRDLSISPKKDKRYFLRFEGASLSTDVNVNGKKIGHHDGAFGAFCYEITPFLNQDENSVSVTVDNTFNSDIPPVSGDFTMFGGLYRPVTLIETGMTCINPANPLASSGIQLSQQRLTDKEGVLDISAIISGNPSKVVATVTDANGKQVTETVLSTENSESKGTITVQNPTRWNGIQNPYLYSVTVSVYADGKKTDEVTQKWGFRTVEIDTARGFVLNGKPMKLRGVNRHQDKEGLGWALSDADHETDIRIMREMGVDAWRAAHYPQASKMYELCDEAGILVWAEIPVVDRVNKTDTFFANAKIQLHEMIQQHRNHPSIVMWGISNELGNGKNGSMSKGAMELMEELYTLSKQLDPTRYCVLAANARRKENTIVDHVGFNTYPGWYGGNAESMKGIITGWCKAYPTKGICVSEYGAGASVKDHEYPVKRPKTIHPFHPEEYQTYCHEHQYRAIKNSAPQLWGSYVWNMYDFGADDRREGDHMGRNDKGLVSYDRETRKDAFYLYQANWTSEPMVHLNSRRFTERKGITAMPFKAFSNCDTVELFLNGKSIGVQKPNDICAFEWVDVSLTSGKNTVKAIGKKDGKTVTDSYEFTVN